MIQHEFCSALNVNRALCARTLYVHVFSALYIVLVRMHMHALHVHTHICIRRRVRIRIPCDRYRYMYIARVLVDVAIGPCDLRGWRKGISVCTECMSQSLSDDVHAFCQILNDLLPEASYLTYGLRQYCAGFVFE